MPPKRTAGKAQAKGKAKAKAKAVSSKAAPPAKAKGKGKGKVAAGKAKAKTAPAPPPKRTKLDADGRQVQQVAAGLKQATNVPAYVVQMLTPMLDVALLSYKDERHKYQESIVSMTCEVFADIEAELVRAFDEAKAAEATAEEANKATDVIIKEAQGKMAEKQEVADAKKLVLTQHAQVYKERADVVKTYEAAHQSLLTDMQAKGGLTTANEECLKPLVAGVAPERVAGLVKPLLVALQGLELDNSLLVALPDALGKAPDARGTFDATVVQSVVDEVEQRCAPAAEELAQLRPKLEACAAALAEAQASFEEANKQQQQSANDLWAAQADVKVEADKVDKLLTDTRGTSRQLVKASKDLVASEKKLTTFRSGPLAALTALRDRRPESPSQAASSAEEGEKLEAAAAAPEEGEADAAEAGTVEEVEDVAEAEAEEGAEEPQEAEEEAPQSAVAAMDVEETTVPVPKVATMELASFDGLVKGGC